MCLAFLQQPNPLVLTAALPEADGAAVLSQRTKSHEDWPELLSNFARVHGGPARARMDDDASNDERVREKESSEALFCEVSDVSL